MNRTFVRWTPAMLAPVLVAAAAIGFSGQASAVVDLPNKSASQILAMINTNPDISFSGTVIKRAAIDAAFCSAERVTFAGSIIPDLIMSTYSPVAALRP